MNEEQKLVLCFLLTTVLYLGDAGNSPTAPNEPRNISRKSKTCNSITISWKKPMGMEADSEIHYEIFSGGVDNGILLGNVTGVRRAHLSSLQPDTLYMLRVRARNTFGPGPPSLPENITTKSIKCLGVRILSNEISGRTATVTVKIQDSNSFLCNITKQSDSDSTASIMEIEGNITNTINNLNPNTTYNVDCSIEGNMCTKAKGTFTTNATVPGNVTSVLENVSCNSIMISWHPPKEDGGSTILDYNVSIFRLNENRNNRLVLRTTVLTGGNTTVSYFGLKPRTQYSVHISAKNSVGLGLPLVHPVTTDKRMRMTINVTRISRNSAMLSTNSRDLLLCWIESTTGQVNFSVTVEKMPTLMNLTSNTKYTFDCIGKDNQCAFSKGNFETLALTVPRHPTSVTDDMKTCTSTHISWMKPDDDGGSAVLGYNVTIFNGSEHRYVSYNGVNSLRVTLMSLKPKTSYNLYIRARNSVGLGPPAVFNFTTEDTRNISTMAAVTTSNSINFTLNDTSQEYVCIIVPQDAIAMQPSVLIRGTGVFTGLKPNTNYYLNCVGINDNCSVSSTSFQTRVGAPNPPAINAMTENCTTITLSLTPPNITGGQKIQEYNIIWYTRSEEQPETRIVPGNSTSVTLTGLSPNTSYTINVSSSNSEVTGYVASITSVTAERNQGNLMVNSINATSLQFFHSLGMQIEYSCREDGSGSQSFNVPNKRYTLSMLQPDTEYTFNCVAYRNGVDYCLEVNTKKKTLPAKINGLNVTGLAYVEDGNIHQSISWKKPENHTSVLQYIITYGAENGPVQTTNTVFNLTFPNKSESYVVEVAAKSDAGLGEYQKIDIKYKVPGAPKIIQIENGTVTCNSVSLQWSPPDDTGGLPIVGYSISKNGKRFKTLSSGQQTNTVLRNLRPGRSYSIEVKAQNAINSGEAQHISVTTKSRDHFELQFHPYSSTKANLIITPSDNEDGIIYSCTLSPSLKLKARVLKNISEHNITLENLKANTAYQVECLVHSKGGEELCYEGKANGSTFPSVPDIAPTNVTVTNTSSNHFTVEWDLPEEYKNNQDIEGYNVIVYRKKKSSGGLSKRIKCNKTVHSTAYTATELGTDKVYVFRVAAFTANGIGTYSEVEIATIPTVQNITISKISNTSAIVQWNRASIGYIVWFVLSVNDRYLFGNRSFAPVNLTSHTEIRIDNLDPFRNYTFNMYLQLKKRGTGSKEQKTFKTLGAEPTEVPTNLSVVSDKRNATLYWGIPPASGRNGIITSYTIEWTSPGLQTSPINYTASQPNFTHPEQILSTLTGLSPYTNYTWRVAAMNIDGTGPFSMWSNFSTKEDVPNRVENLKVTHTTASRITVQWNVPSPPNGVIIAYSICYWILGNKCAQAMNVSQAKKTIQDLDPGIPYKISVTAFTSAGQGEDNIYDDIIFTEELPPNRTVTGINVNWTNSSTVKISWTPLTLHEARGIPTYRVNITSEGRAIRSKLINDSHLSVGGLDQAKLYSVSVQPLTNGGKAPGETSNFVSFGSPTTQSTFPVWIVIIVVLLILAILICLVILIIIVLFCKYKRQQKEVDLMEEVLSMKEVVAVVDDSIVAHHNMQRKEPIPKHLFCEHVRKMHHNKDDRFKTEFGDITKEPPVSKEASETNRQKNRYINIYPYDYSRVVLSDSDGSDYVNAAFLDGYKSPKRYIASQGPTPVTTADFWEMIWEQKTTVIVMLTRLVEGTRIKCEQYWNEEMNATYEPGRNLRVTMTNNKVMTGFEVRQFRVEKTSTKSDPVKVKHFLYTAWPDHGVPQYTSSMVKFILHQYKPEVKDSTAPIVVHCSAGAGRTGTFVAIDTAIDRLAEEDDINIFECVELMRARRTQMVQNVSQYIYIHDAINDYVTCGETAIVAHELGQKKSEMKKTDPNTNKTGFEQLFKLLQETSAEVCDDDKEFSRRQDIAERNRYKTRYPYSDNFIQTEDDETYINATEIKGYYGQGTFIAAQAPMKNTIEDTWNVIRQQNCSVVVVLTNFEEQSQEMCAEFWPGEVGVPMEIGYMKISLTNTVHNEQFDEHKLSISVEEADIVNKVDVYHYKAWMKHSSPDVPSLLKLMGDVQRSHQGSSGPLMVMCDDGMSRTGVFITVMSEIDRVKVEGEMDIFHTVKAARTDRPHMVSTVGDYECCHEILQQYLESFDTYANFK